MNHKCLWLLLFWLIFLTGAILLQLVITVELPLADMVNLAGYISLAYVGISKGANIVKAFKSPCGEFGFEYQPPHKDRMLWITIVWILLIMLVLIVRALVPENIAVPVDEVIVFAGVLSITFVAANKGEKIGAAAGTDKPGKENGNL
ncbi:MAG: hypothetical protein JXB88_26170 [Spirochaetales bacterium]|nr:hypothetical protein [Spirochaetales bacterium]